MNALDALLASPAAAAMDPFVRALTRAADGFDLSPQMVQLAAEVAAWPPDLEVDERRALLLAVVASWVAVRQGSTRLRVDSSAGAPLVEQLDALVTRARLDSGLAIQGGAWWARALGELLAGGRAAAVVGARGDTRPLIHDPPYLYLHRSLALEERFAAAVAPLVPAAAPDTALVTRPDPATAEQREAIRRAVQPGLTVITGGPGSGKTSIIVRVLHELASRGVPMADVALVAPTGKAAQRMRAAIEGALAHLPDTSPADRAVRDYPVPATLHRLLGYSPSTGRFRHHENNRLAQAHVIVDEASMVDLALAEQLVRSIRPGASLVLLGDDRQLPSVDAGQPLRDLVSAAARVPALAARLVSLSHSHRMDAGSTEGAAILAASQAVRAGAVPAPVPRAGAAAVALAGVELVPAPALDDLLERWYQRFFATHPDWQPAHDEYHQGAGGFPPDETARIERLFAHLESFCVLCYTHAYPEGTVAINAAFHRKVVAAAGFDSEYYPGEPVVMLANDYERGVFNGDTGLVLRVRPEAAERHHHMLVFRRAGGFAAFHVGSLRDRVRHAFALTVHKAQGSEHDHVLLVLPAEDFPMNTRELVYTALTRARRSVTIAGAASILARGAAREVRRDSGVPARLEAALLRPGTSPA